MDRQSEIRDFLMSRRARISPEEAGLPVYGGVRRVPGLRREEVAQAAAISVDYYNRLERGRVVGASAEVLSSIPTQQMKSEPSKELPMITSTLYTAEALSTGGGRDGHVRTTDGRVDFELAIPKSMGGSGDGANPELLFAAGYAACFHSALHTVARAQKVTLTDSTVGSRVQIGSNGDGGFELAVQLEVIIPDLPREQAQALADAADKICPYSNATRGNIQVNVTVADD